MSAFVVHNLLAVVCCFAFAVFGMSLGRQETLSEIWPLSGVALFLLCRYRPRIIPGIFLGMFAAYFAHGFSVMLSGGLALANAVALLSAAALLCRRFHFTGDFEQPRETTIFLFFGVLVESVVAAFLVTLCLAAAYSLTLEAALENAVRIWVGHATGGLIVAPVLFTWDSNLRRLARKSFAGFLELAFLIVGLAGSLYLVLYAETTHDFSQGAFMLIPIPFIIWTALRMGPRGTSLMLLGTAVLCVHATLSGSGPFRGTPSALQMACVLGFLAYLMLFTSSKIRQQERTTGALRQAEALSNELRARYQSLVENVSDVIYRMDPDGTITYVSPAVIALAGYCPRDLVGRPYFDIVHPDDAARVWANFQSAVAGNLTADTFRAVAKDGGIRHVHASSRAEVRNGEVVSVLGVINDRTEVVEMMRALETSEETYRTLVENLSDVIYQFAPDGTITYISPIAETIFGVSTGEMRNQPFGERVHPDDRAAFREYFARTLAGESLSYEIRLRDKAGNIIYVRCSSRPLVKNGEIMGVTGIASNISSLKAAQTALREREALLTAAFDNLPFDFWACDGEGRYVIQNPTSQDNWGDCVGKHPANIEGLNPDVLALWQTNNTAAMRGEIVQQEFSLVRGEVRHHFQAIIAPIRDGDYIIGTLGVNIDITEQRQSEEAYARLVESSPQGLAIVQDARFVFVNGALQEMLQYSAGALLDLAEGNWLEVLHPDDPDLLREAYEQILRAEERPALDTPPFEVVGTRADGVKRWFQVFCSPLVYRGRPAVQAVYVDVTQQKEAEKDRQLLETQMQHTQKLESLGVMAGGIAHDFNNLLTGILGNAEMLLVDSVESAGSRKPLEHIVLTARRAAELCQQMLAYAGRAQFFVTDVSLNDIIGEMTDLLRASISKKARVVLTLDPAVPVIHADASQIRQVALNLITNASEALGDEEGTIRIQTGLTTLEDARIGEAYLEENLPEGTYCFLEVCDTGSGMEPETRDRLFEPFFTTKFTGRGLGLAAVIGIVHAHKGVILVESAPGKGSCFRMILPTVKESRPAAPPVAVVENFGDLRGTVLVVDDEPTVQHTAQRLLHRLGLQVLNAEDGVAGLAQLAAHRDEIGLILLDVTMPRMGGDEVLRILRENGCVTPVILMSGYATDDMRSRFDGENLAGFLQKPFAFNDFNTLVRNVLTMTR